MQFEEVFREGSGRSHVRVGSQSSHRLRPGVRDHGTAAYDYSKTFDVKATITDFRWANPHCQIEFDVKEDNGTTEHWIIEAFNPAMLRREGWNLGRETFKPGDEVTISFYPAKNGQKVGILDKAVLASGQVVHQRVAQSQGGYYPSRRSCGRPPETGDSKCAIHSWGRLLRRRPRWPSLHF
jgi:Family of unknown function (DUF6152)